MRNAPNSRLPLLLATMALLGGCDASAPEKAQEATKAGEVTLVLPPALPPAPADEPVPEVTAAAVPVEPTPPGPAATATSGAEATVQLSDAPAEPGLVSAPPPIAMSSLARYIRGAGFACDEVVSSRQLEREGARAGIYKFDCGSGQSYQGTMRQNHLYFREWRGVPAG